MTEQQKLDIFSEMNRYDERDEDFPSAAVYESPRRTLGNNWAKFHAARDCGARNVAFVENTKHSPVSEKYEFSIRCWQCGHRVDEDEVLFIGGDWWSEHGWLEYGKTLEDLFIPPERVLDLGPDPDRDELVDALNLSRIERNASVFGLTFGNERYDECADCGQETFLLFDDRCRMCYDGEWTDRMQETVNAAETSIRERNDSFVHRLEQEIDPLSIKNRCHEDKILWRRHDRERAPKLVVVTQCLQDDADGHWEYVLQDPTLTEREQYRQEDLADCFWDTGLYASDVTKPVQNDRIRELWNRVRHR